MIVFGDIKVPPIGGMYPVAIAFKDELGKFDATFLLHLLYQLEQATVAQQTDGQKLTK